MDGTGEEKANGCEILTGSPLVVCVGVHVKVATARAASMCVLAPVCFVGVFSFPSQMLPLFSCVCAAAVRVSWTRSSPIAVTAPARSKGGCILRGFVYYWPYRAIPRMTAGEQRPDERSALMGRHRQTPGCEAQGRVRKPDTCHIFTFGLSFEVHRTSRDSM